MNNGLHDLTAKVETGDEVADLHARARSASLTQLAGLLRLASEPRDLGETVAPFADPPEWMECLGEIAQVAASDAQAWVKTVLDASASIEILRHVRHQARAAVERAFGSPQRTAAQLLYHVATAAAFLYHGVNIGERPLATRRALYALLADQLGGGAISDLLSRTARALETGPNR